MNNETQNLTMDNLMAADATELQNIKDIGFILANNIANYFELKENRELISKLKSYGVNMTYEKEEILTHELITNKKFVITGTLDGITRDELKDIILRYGGSTSDSVSSKTDVVIVGENAGSKLEKARKLNIEIWSQEKINDLLTKL